MNGVGVWRSYTPPMACTAMALSMIDSAGVLAHSRRVNKIGKRGRHGCFGQDGSCRRPLPRDPPVSPKQCSFQYVES